MYKHKLTKCPFCGSKLIHSDEIGENKELKDKINTRSEEHIVPKSLGNDDLVLQKGIICDNCNHYFSINVEKLFLEIETIKLLRSYHLVPSRKNKVPPLDVLFCGDNAILKYDKNLNTMIMEIDPYTCYKLISGVKPNWFFSKCIDINQLKNNYIVSRFLVKIFTEINLYYMLVATEESSDYDENFYFEFDNKMKELFDYARYGKVNKLYDYKVEQIKDIIPLSNDDFICSIELLVNNDEITGMIFKLYELQFALYI